MTPTYSAVILPPMDTNGLITLEDLAVLGARRREERAVHYEVLGELTQADLAANAALPTPGTSPVQLRHSHHLLAWAIAQGKTGTEISLVTGYSPGRISVLKDSPAFQELIAYYETQAEAVDLDIRARITAMGLDFAQELHERLLDKPGSFTNNEALAVATELLDRGLGSAPGKKSGGASISIEFVAATPQPKDISPTGTRDGEGRGPLGTTIILEQNP